MFMLLICMTGGSKMWFFRRRRKNLIAKRQEYCANFFEDIRERFSSILTGDVPYVMCKSQRLYCDKEAIPENDRGMDLDIHTITTNERVLLGEYDVYDNSIGMTNEMTSYQMSKDFSQITKNWDIEYVPVGDNVRVFARYSADYRFKYQENGTFIVEECHSGTTRRYDVPFFMTDKEVNEIHQHQPNAKIDFVDAKPWRVVCTGNNKAKLFTMQDYIKHRNIWVAQIVDGKLQFKPAMTENPETNKVWYDKNYLTKEEAMWVYEQSRYISNSARKSLGYRGHTPNQQR